MICNGGINPYHQPISTVIIDAKAGDTITSEWHHSLAGADPTDPADPIDSSHKGPVIAYLYVYVAYRAAHGLNTNVGRRFQMHFNRM